MVYPIPADIPGITFPEPTLPVARISPRIFLDNRGSFSELLRIDALKPLLGPLRFKQESLSKSKPYVIRGMHYQLDQCGKLIRCIAGSMFQVSVDVRADSATFGQWYGQHLSEKTMDAIWVPPGFANGFMALETGAVALYLQTAVFDAELERGLLWCDPGVGIRWPRGRGLPLTVSVKDRQQKGIGEIERWRG